MTPEQSAKLLTMKEAAKLLRIGRNKISDLALAVPPLLYTIKIGRKRLVPVDEIDRFIERRLLEAQHGRAS